QEVTNRVGGGILCRGAATIRGNIISDNRADFGAAVYAGGGPLRIEDSLILRNTATMYGAVYSTAYLTTLLGNTFEDNTAGWGAGACLGFTVMEVARNTFRNNRATQEGGGLFVLG